MISCSPRSRSTNVVEMAFENMRNKRILIKFAKDYIRSSLSLFDRILRLKDIREDGRSKIRDPKEVQRPHDASYTLSFSNVADDHQAFEIDGFLFEE